MSNTRILNAEEQKALEPIAKAHGIFFNGGCCVTENGVRTYHVGFDAIMNTFGTKLGPKVKMALKADQLILSGPNFRQTLD